MARSSIVSMKSPGPLYYKLKTFQCMCNAIRDVKFTVCATSFGSPISLYVQRYLEHQFHCMCNAIWDVTLTLCATSFRTSVSLYVQSHLGRQFHCMCNVIWDVSFTVCAKSFGTSFCTSFKDVTWHLFV